MGKAVTNLSPSFASPYPLVRDMIQATLDCLRLRLEDHQLVKLVMWRTVLTE